MNITIKKIFVICAIAMSLFIVQSAGAEILVEGTIGLVSSQPNMVVVIDTEDYPNGVEVYGVMYNYLLKHHDLDLKNLPDTTEVSFRVSTFECSDGTTRFQALAITVEGGEEICLRECE